MTDWRLATDSVDELREVLATGTWRSETDRDVMKLSLGDRAILYCLKGKGQGYWGAASVSREMYRVEDEAKPFRVDLEISRAREEAVPPGKVKPVLQQARLRIRQLPLYVIELS